MKKLLFFPIAIIAISFSACRNNPQTENEHKIEHEKLTKLEKLFKSTKDSLDVYKKIPFIYIKNPLDSKDSVLLKNPRSWIVLDSSLQKISKYADDLLTHKLGTDYYVKTELNFEKEQQIIKDFKRDNRAFCERWAKHLLDDQIGLNTQENEVFEMNPAYQKMEDRVSALDNEQSKLFTTKWAEVRSLRDIDIKEQWEKFKKAN